MDELFSGSPAESAAQPRSGQPDGGDPPTGPQEGPSRRTVVLCAALSVLAGAGAGVAAAFARPRRAVPDPAGVPAPLRTALAREQRLLALSDRLAETDPALARQLRTDHRAHARAVEAAIREVGAASVRSPATASQRAPEISRAQLRSAETSAAAAAAAEAARLRGKHAALLASVAACEAGHAELLR
jgi:hypothetical protein